MFKFYFKLLLVFVMMLVFSAQQIRAQSEVLTKADSIVAGDTISSINPGGMYEAGCFTLRSVTIGDTLIPQVRYGNSNQWVTARVTLIKTQASDTIIRISPTGFPLDYQIVDPVNRGFRLISTAPAYMPTRKTYVHYRFRR